ncbi:alanine racemase [Amphritea pacifica]|uniref:Alanine racemase n=1 Tax=Amphritea pacifica TaxID=2811233 RepID=A0ABS2W9I1_9GAMM|nr:alanine racemase [Amphritea pacifica]MBN0988236.1 alanine racemase [Amphritea pacifica]MBN1008678.1 alanine racemase [Amphritea pacifica]
MSRAAKITVDLEAIRQNYRLARSLNTAGNAAAIIKADAYGHNAVKVARALQAEADAFGVACIEEGIELIEAGIQKPVLLLEGFFEVSELPYISEHGMWCAVHSLHQIEQIAQASLSKPVTVWLKMNSGMNRLGIHPDDYQAAFQRLQQLDNVSDIVLMTHFASSDELDKATTEQQLAVFNRASEGLDAPHCLANSAAVLAWQDARRDWMRPGLMLYGATPFPEAQEQADKLLPAMTLTSEVIAIRDVQPGECVGYGGNFVADKPTRVGTVALGYADGYPRHAVTGTPVWINGQRARIIGRVSMDMLGVDLTGIPDAGIGTEVEFWGRNVTAAEVATCCDTIPYTLFTGITRRVHKRYINE